MELILFYISLATLIAQVVYLMYLSLWKKSAAETAPHTGPEVTVLICARNEAQHLNELMPMLLHQTYRNCKILVVNDQSTDETVEVVRQWQQKAVDKVQYFSIVRKHSKGKKGAIREVVPHVRSPYILFTDADCRPLSHDWISLMMAAMQEKKSKIVLGYSPVAASNSLLGDLQRWYNTWTTWQYIGAAYQDRPFMSIGRNWAVETELYRKHQNIERHGQIASGDDDLVFQALSEKAGTVVQLNRKAWMVTFAAGSWAAFFRQGLRHLEAGFAYPLRVKASLALFPAAVLLHYICSFLLLATLWPVGLAMLALPPLVWIFFSWRVLRHLGQQDLYLKVFYLMPMELCFRALVFVLTLLGMKSDWK